ncbi:MAG: 3-oxoacyl-ACP reductase FabG [Desulfobacterales bacterium]|nr:MAG: 3-oxoacyl-ACP reductase FabG [Desulfobacterales bacterium]
MDLNDKVALITGGSRGIGKAISLELSKKGAAIAVNYVTKADSADWVVNEILKSKGKAIKIKADVSKPKEVEEMFRTVLDNFGSLDILVNNAGTAGQPHLLEISEPEWDRVLGVNLKGIFNCCQMAIPIFLEQGGGKIVNFSSVAGKMGGVSGVHYAASKAGVIGLTMALSTEFANKNIYVNAIAPGPIRTEMFESLPPATQKHLADLTHVGRVGEPREIAHAVVFLLENDFITGETINMSAGRYMD